MPHLDHMQRGLERPTRRYPQFIVLAVSSPLPSLTAIDLLLAVMHFVCWEYVKLFYLRNVLLSVAAAAYLCKRLSVMRA